MSEEGLFRKESMEHISSPEEMHDYLRVTSPRLWMLLAAILALLVGFLIFASTTAIESTEKVTAVVSYGSILSSLPEEQGSLISIGMPVRVGGLKAKVTDIIQTASLHLTLRLDSGEALEEGYHEFSYADEQPDEDSLNYFTVMQGIVTMPDTAANREALSKDRRVRVKGSLGTVTDAQPISTYVLMLMPDIAGETLADGTYQAEIVTESTTPLSFLLN